MGASCRGKEVELARALLAEECAVGEDVAKRIGASRPALRASMTVTPARVSYDDALAITLTVTNESTAEIPLAFYLHPEDLAMVLLSGTMWLLPPAKWAQAARAPRFAAVILAPGGSARAKIDTRMTAMTNSFDVSCPGNCYTEVQWDPGASFRPGRYTLTGSMPLLGADLDWRAVVDVEH